MPIYPVLKRPDERWVTMEAYENPVFVEDMVRGVASRSIQDERITWFKVHACNFESIHGHDAFASTTWSARRTAAPSRARAPWSSARVRGLARSAAPRV